MALDDISRTERETIRIVLADADRQLRLALRQALIYAGFKSVLDVGTAEALHGVLDKSPPELLVVAAKLPDGDGAAVVRALRHARCGRDPFLSVILTAWPDEAEDLGRLINSGTDHIVLKPVAPQALFDRMQAMIERRKPFVATATYLGPDRRSGNREEDAAIPTFEVPNTLKQRARGQPVDQAALQRAIDASMARINEELVRRQAFQIMFLVERAGPRLEDGAAPPLVAAIGLAAQDLTRRLDPGTHAHVAELSRGLDRHLAGALGRAGSGRWDPRDIELLRKLAQAIYVGLHNEADLSELSQKVACAVDTFQTRQAQRAAVSA